MSRFLAAIAGALGRVLGLARPLAVLPVPAPRVAPSTPRAGQVTRVPGLPGDWPPIERGAP